MNHRDAPCLRGSFLFGTVRADNRYMRKLPVLACLALSACLAAGAAAQGSVTLAAEFRAELAPDPAGGASPIGPEEAARRLLEEARWSFAGMIRGFRFRYVPADLARGVAELIELESLGGIPWGDPALRVVETVRSEGTLRARIEFSCDASRAAELAAWRSADFMAAAGTGRARVAGGVERRRNAVEDAVAEALRALFRTVVLEKPREISGVLAFAEAPRVVVSSGDYAATVRLRVKATEIRPYPAY